jgi:imidazole glycerol-phosphate synthase subunit HisH
MPAVTIIDSGICNLGSIARALERAGASVAIAASPLDVAQAQRLVMPGVGSFPAGMKALNERGFTAAIRAFAASGRPMLGICLGMQLLLDEGEEFTKTRGLGIVPGRVRAIDAHGQRVPHMGFNEIAKTNEDPLLAGVSQRFLYFVHSFVCEPANGRDVLATTEYGEKFCSVLRRGNVWGVQAHPEKSQRAGLRLLRNFLEQA